MNSKLYITFNEDFVLNDTLQFVANNGGVLSTMMETWKGIRNAPFKVTVGVPTEIPGERSAINFVAAFNLDYNATGLYTVSRVGSDVIITSNLATVLFQDPVSSQTEDVVQFVIDNNEGALISIDDVTFDQADSSPCSNVKVTVGTSVLATKILSPVVVNPNAANPFNFTVSRGGSIVLLLENADGAQATQTITLPQSLNAANFSVSVTNSPNGATATIGSSNVDGLDLEYSLDGTDWQASNVFAGLEVADYTLHVRDQLGCSFTKDFSVTEFAIYSPYLYISKANAIRFARRITWGDAANYKTDENTLSFEVDVKNPFKEIQQFQTADVITTQFKSNYASNTALIINPDLSETSVSVIQKTSNIGQKEKRDAKQYDYGGGKTGIYFTAGNIYDYDSDAITGPFALYGTLPIWAVAGNYVVIDNAWYLIEEIVFDENKNADVIIISSNYAGAEIDIVAGSIYNVQPYEVYEFAIDMATREGQTFQVRLDNNDPSFGDVTHVSEFINVERRQENTAEMVYWNDENNDVYYTSGIRHKIRCELFKASGAFPDAKSDAYKTDTNVRMLSAEMYEGEEFQFEPVTKEIMRKILIALMHENLFIDEVGYALTETPEVEGPIEDSNLYHIKAKLLKSGYVYNSQGTGDDLYNGEAIEIPGLIDSGDGFVKY